METKTQQVALSVENQVELTALCNMLELAGGFTLGFARVNHPKLRARLVEEVRRRLPGKAINELTLDPRSESGVVAQLEEAFGQQNLDGVFLYGLDAMFDLTTRQSPAMDALNLNRNYFGKRFPFPVVFWLPEFAMRELSRQAPDFWAWRSGTYYFVGEEGDAAETLRGLDEEPTGSITLREKRGRREILEHVLAELQAAARPDPRSLADTYYLLGQANYYEDEINAAGAYFEKALPLFRKLEDRRGEADAIKSLGDVALSQDRYEQAAESYQQALPIYRQIGARLGEADAIKNLGDVALSQDRYEQAAESYQQALPIYRQIGARLGEADAIRSLGDVALSQDRYEQAAESYQQALPIYRQIGARLGEANAIQSLGDVALSQDRYEQAAESRPL